MKTAYLSIPCLATCLGISLLSMTTLSSCSKESSSSSTVAASKFPTETESLTDYRLDMDIVVRDNAEVPHQLKQNPDSISFLTPNNAELSFGGILYPVTYTYKVSDVGNFGALAEVTFTIPAEMTLDNNSEASMYIGMHSIETDGRVTVTSESGYTPIPLGLRYPFVDAAVRLYKPKE